MNHIEGEGENQVENLLLVRIDDRLIHGQVMTTWMKVLPAKRIIIVDDKVARDVFMKEVLKMAAPDGVKVEVHTVESAVPLFTEGFSVPTFVLVKTPLTLKELVDQGVKLPAINIGGMGMNAGRKKLFKNIAATEEERIILKDFIDAGIDVKVQIIPSEKIIEVKSLV